MKKDLAFKLFYNFMSGVTTVPEDQWQKISQHLTLNTFKSGEHLIHQGDETQMAYFVVDGIVRTYFTDPEGKEVTKGFAWEGRLASPYVAILTKRPSNFSIIAMEDSICVGFDYSQVRHLYKEHICWQEFGRVIAESLLIERERREFQMLMHNATQRYKWFLEDYKIIADRIPNYEIASYLGITAVALSNIRRDLK